MLKSVTWREEPLYGTGPEQQFHGGLQARTRGLPAAPTEGIDEARHPPSAPKVLGA